LVKTMTGAMPWVVASSWRRRRMPRSVSERPWAVLAIWATL
jgi:hypothetical protein